MMISTQFLAKLLHLSHETYSSVGAFVDTLYHLFMWTLHLERTFKEAWQSSDD